MVASIGELEATIGYRFSDPEILQRAVTHRSWAYENSLAANESKGSVAQNETLEFLGDSVLGLAVAEQVFQMHPEMTEGDLTLIKHQLVSSETLVEVAGEIDLGRFLRLGKGEESSGGRKRKNILSDTLEAVIGAVFVDGGFVQARALVRRLLGKRLKAATPDSARDYKSLLQHTLHARGLDSPEYRLLRTDGPSHNRKFWVEVLWESGRQTGSGRSVKKAEMKAARRALDELGMTAAETKNPK